MWRRRRSTQNVCCFAGCVSVTAGNCGPDFEDVWIGSGTRRLIGFEKITRGWGLGWCHGEWISFMMGNANPVYVIGAHGLAARF